MTSQQHADDLLHTWQANRELSPLLRLQRIACLDGLVTPAPRDDAALDRTLSAVIDAMHEPDGFSTPRSTASQQAPILDGFSAAKIEIMAQDLVRYRAFNEEQAAICLLSNRGHGARDIGRMVRRARARARELHAAAPKRISR